MNGFAERRKSAGITQQELADAVNVDRSAVAKWETGHAFPNGKKLPEIAKALNCRIEDLYGGKPGKNAQPKRKRTKKSATAQGESA